MKLATTTKALRQGEAGGLAHGFLHWIKQFYPDPIRIPIRPNPLVFDDRNWIYVSQYTPMAEADR